MGFFTSLFHKAGLDRARGGARIFMDYASATPISERVAQTYECYAKTFFNPAAVYTEGVQGKKYIQDARMRIGALFGAHEQEIIFTSGGTESANLALRGVVAAAKAQGIARPHVVVTAFEHVCILETISQLEMDGVFVTTIHPHENGLIDPKQIEQVLNPDTVMVCVMYANNEIGTIQPLREIAKSIKRYRRNQKRDEHCAYPYFISDASQAPNYLDCNIQQLGVDALILDGLKTYGPRPAGLLVVKRAVDMVSIMSGGSHQRGLRPGTESVAVAMAMATCLEECALMRGAESARMYVLQHYFLKKLEVFGNKISLNGSYEKNERLPNNVNICIKNYDSEFLVIQLDVAGIACSSASSCATLKDSGGSYVIATLGEGKASCVDSSVRFTMGRGTTKAHIDRVVDALSKIL